MPNIVLGVTGSVAAIKTPGLYASLRDSGHHVRVVATEPSTYFFDVDSLLPERGEEGQADAHEPVFRDRDEWPATRYQRNDPVLHIEFRNWADLFIVAPLDANTLAKFALGLCDNFVTCLYRAWDPSKPMILAPAMNTLMWQHPATARHLGQILLDSRAGLDRLPGGWSLESAADHFALMAPRIVLIPPQSKRLACGDVGVGAMADVPEIAEAVRAWSLTAERLQSP